MTKLKLKKTLKATYNYTGRKKIRSKWFDLKVLSQDENTLDLEFNLDLKSIDIGGNKLILEAIYSGQYERVKLSSSQDKQLIKLEGFPENSNPSFRLKVLPNIKVDGKIIYSSTIFKANREKVDIYINNDFLEFQKADLNGEIWSIEWINGEPEIKLNKKFHELYDLNVDKHILVFILPSLLREILTGIFIRNNEEPSENTRSYNWIKFCESKLNQWSKPDDNEWNNKEGLLELVDNAILEFCNKKWDGENLLLDYLLKKRL